MDINLYDAKCDISDIVKFQSSFGIAEVVVSDSFHLKNLFLQRVFNSASYVVSTARVIRVPDIYCVLIHVLGSQSFIYSSSLQHNFNSRNIPMKMIL